jgi:hypothetical protein
MDIVEEIEEVAKLFPVLAQVYRDSKARVAAAKAASSDGGAKVTPAEVFGIVAAETPAITKAIAELIADLA